MATSTEKQAVKLETGIAGLTVTIGSDGVWFHFDNGSGQKGGFNLGNYAIEKGSIVGKSIGGWVNKIHDKYWKSDLEKYMDGLKAEGIEFLRGGDDTNIEIIVGNKVRIFNADGSDVNGEDLSGSVMTEMPRYKSHKEVWALKIGGIQYKSNAQGSAGATIVPDNADYEPIDVSEQYMNKHKPVVGGYYVVYEDGYKSYSPATAFERGNTLISGKSGGRTFGAAIEAMKQGHKVARSGWNGKGMFLYYVPANVYPASGNKLNTMAGVFPDDMVPYGEYIAMKTEQDNVVPWVASQTDMLADDWHLIT